MGFDRMSEGGAWRGGCLLDAAFLCDDQQSHPGSDVEGHDDDLEHPEERVNDHVVGLTGEREKFALYTVDKIRGQH